MALLTKGTPFASFLSMCIASVAAVAQTAAPSDLTQATLEDLMNIKVTSVSKKDQQAFQAGAAIFVITAEDIRRSGASNIPDLLRMVPGVNVARVDANTWAISIRGFNGEYANKLLVMMLMTPFTAFAPHTVPPGPRITSMRSMSSRGTFNWSQYTPEKAGV